MSKNEVIYEAIIREAEKEVDLKLGELSHFSSSNMDPIIGRTIYEFMYSQHDVVSNSFKTGRVIFTQTQCIIRLGDSASLPYLMADPDFIKQLGEALKEIFEF